MLNIHSNGMGVVNSFNKKVACGWGGEWSLGDSVRKTLTTGALYLTLYIKELQFFYSISTLMQ